MQDDPFGIYELDAELTRRQVLLYIVLDRLQQVAGILATLLAILAIFWLFARPACAEDLAVGDSIAVGTGSALHVRTAARVGAGSCAILGSAPGGAFEHVVISAGVNDPPGNCDAAIRAKYRGAKVVWIVPAKTSAITHIRALAAQNGDLTVSYRPGPDGLHPRSYPSVAAAVRRAWGMKFGNVSVAETKKTVVIAAAPAEPAVVLNPRQGGVAYTPPIPEKIVPAPVPPTTQGSAKGIWRRIHDFFLPSHVSAMIEQESAKEGVPAELVKRVAHAESGGNCNIRAADGLSTGLMQVRPETARAMGVTGDQNDCRNSVIAGARYLKLALKRAHGDWGRAAALYNGGLGAAQRYTAYSQKVLNAGN